ncbi:unnamed protein product [Leptosia nina]|uniref:26S proteasome non-ATPase regulatory subunit 5 n=1 Tax=Leptosia nina TaxID=320188 RepID=A0AAV1J9K4_9NEOP
MEQYSVIIQNLQSEEQRSQALDDLKNLLNFTPPSQAAPVIQNCGITKIVECLNVKNRSHVASSCELLKMCFEMFEPEDIVRNYIANIMYLLRHGETCVRQLAIDVVYKVFTRDQSVLASPQYVDVFVAIAQMVCDSDVGIANKAILITSNLPHDTYPKVLEELKIALDCSTSSKCNAFEIVVNISLKNSELFKLCKDQGYIDAMVSELEADDILYQLNILELLSRLAVAPHGLTYLIKNGSFNKLVQLLQDLQNNPLKGLLITGYIKFFGTVICHYSREVIHQYPILVESLLDSFDEVDETVFPVVLDTLGVIGTTIEGKLCLAEFGSNVEQDPKSKDGVDQRVTLMTREWFRSFSKQPPAIETLLTTCKNPFPDIQCAAFMLLDAVCQHHWGEELVANCAGFIEFLLDRTVDLTKPLQEIKYDIIKRLSRSSAFDSNILMRLQTYVEQGPFYSESLMQVAMEEAD